MHGFKTSSEPLIQLVLLAVTKLKGNFPLYLLELVLLIICSIPMASINIFPIWLENQPYPLVFGPVYYFSCLVLTLAFVSPWILLTTAVVFYAKHYRIRSYVATILFLWATEAQIFYILLRIVDITSTYPWLHLN